MTKEEKDSIIAGVTRVSFLPEEGDGKGLLVIDKRIIGDLMLLKFEGRGPEISADCFTIDNETEEKEMIETALTAINDCCHVLEHIHVYKFLLKKGKLDRLFKLCKTIADNEHQQDKGNS